MREVESWWHVVGLVYDWKNSFRCVNLSLRVVVPLIEYFFFRGVYEFGKFRRSITR